MSVINRIVNALRMASSVRRANNAYLNATSVDTCLATVVVFSADVVDALADRYGVGVGPTPYVTAMRLVARQWPSSWVATEVVNNELRLQAMLAQLANVGVVRV
jgi:hypothetical protein